MKPFAIALSAVLGFSTVTSAQALKIDDLRAPTSPAFVLLGVTPAAVERPENPRALSASLINVVSKSKGLPQNYGLEVAPYWLTDHPTLGFNEYQSPGAMSIVQTLSFSVATAPIEAPAGATSSDPLGTRIGVGVRTILWNGRFSPKLNELVDEVYTLQGRLLDAENIIDPPGGAPDLQGEVDARRASLDRAARELEAARDAVQSTPPGGPAMNDAVSRRDRAVLARDAAEASLGEATAVLKKRQDEVAAAERDAQSIEASLTETALAIQELDAHRLGFILTFAGAQAWDVPQDDLEQRTPGKWGWWLTPTYRFRGCTAAGACDATLDFIGVVRAIKEPGKDVAWDVGGRIVWQPVKEFNLSMEALRRRAHDATPSSNRTTGMLEYQLGDDVSLYASFGRDFEKDTGQKPLTSMVGLNIGFGKSARVSAENTD